jgi:Ca-activated chloride channel family protein
MSCAVLLFDELLRPGAALYLLCVPLALLVGLVARRATAQARAALVHPRHAQRFLPTRAPRRQELRIALACVGVALLALTLLGPVRGHTVRDVPRKGLDLVVCVDTSKSMLVEDLRRSRLEEAQRQVRALLDHLIGDRVALIAFAGDARRVSPLTRDRKTFGWFLENLSPRENTVGGTDLGAALASALELFDGRSGSHEAIILITDGEDHGGEGLTVAEEAARRGIRVYVLGMGTEVGGKIPLPEGGWQRDAAGAEVVSRLDGETLATIAEATGGAYLTAEGSVLALERLYREGISRLEGRTFSEGKERIPHDRYQWFLFLAVLAMLMETALPDRRFGRAARK